MAEPALAHCVASAGDGLPDATLDVHVAEGVAHVVTDTWVGALYLQRLKVIQLES
jgi:hypothetical protein